MKPKNPLPDWDEDEDEPQKPGPKPERLNIPEPFEQAVKRALDAGKPDGLDEEDEDSEA